MASPCVFVLTLAKNSHRNRRENSLISSRPLSLSSASEAKFPASSAVFFGGWIRVLVEYNDIRALVLALKIT